MEHEPNALSGSTDPGISLASLAELGQVSFPLGLSFPLILKKEFLKALCSPPGVGGEWVCLSPTHTLASLKCVELLTSRQTFRVASFYESMYLIRWVFLFLLYWIE